MRVGTLAQGLVSMSTPPRSPGRPTTACTAMSLRRCVGHMIIVVVLMVAFTIVNPLILLCAANHHLPTLSFFSPLSQLPRLINANFPADPENMSISGHSMGGHGALICALKNPGKYKALQYGSLFIMISTSFEHLNESLSPHPFLSAGCFCVCPHL